MIDLIAYTGVISQDSILLKEAIKLHTLPQNAIFSTVNFFDIWAERKENFIDSTNRFSSKRTQDLYASFK